MTQPDGLSRTDLTDPHAYGGDRRLSRPSSALFGNYANGGAINFRTRTGAEINGVETGSDFGSFGYISNYTAIGKKYETSTSPPSSATCAPTAGRSTRITTRRRSI